MPGFELKKSTLNQAEKKYNPMLFSCKLRPQHLRHWPDP